ncbi:EscV/YscV/HrcV family type III secretion system export apparatus protein [Alsobacter metallidurans]|uniref:EscV/YscV/HrcV family type III secretion system export apparatus protein n=1 Tax=Alsobacter metallidurans TaxID=340221 RepID=A0A917IA71_9HYPH|nr:type III secretion system export apparatus subunit SctV [Alsobacter metallidurans]GGH32118.1 EscV/YscV/HrcV family type III secretion system export apparatus protein [Alsobacter metallidurans]
MMAFLTRTLHRMRGRQDVALIAILLTAVLVMIIPMPTLMLDVLIGLNITMTMVILMVALYIERPTSFSTFPAVILIATTFRLSISISTTRTILTEADGGDIVATFGNFVTGGNLVVGLVIFLIITIVQFVVITKGAERVAEVAARFVLDALPGRQMSIDAELRAGDIDPAEARERRRNLDKENQFFGAMDGAMKFVKGDAIAGLLIVVVNLVGGIAIGAFQKGMPLGQAASTYSLLTIGDGLVAQIPALLLALCAGAIVTRVTTEGGADLGGDIAAELAGSQRSIGAAGVVVSAIGLVPGFPALLFFAFGGVLIWVAWFMPGKAPGRRSGASRGRTADGATDAEPTPSADSHPHERLAIRLGANAFGRLDGRAFAQARDARMDACRRRLGVQTPRFGIELADELPPDTVKVLFDGVALFAEAVAADATVLEGDAAILDAAGAPRRPLARGWRRPHGFWVDSAEAARLIDAGLRLISFEDLLAHAGVEHLKAQSALTLGFEEAHALFAELRTSHPRLAEQAGNAVPMPRMLDVMRRLAGEQVPLVPAQTFFEALAEWGQRETDAAVLAEHVRRAMRRQICDQIADASRVLPAYVVEPGLEQQLRESLRMTESGVFLMMSSRLSNTLLEQIETIVRPEDPAAPPPVVVTAVDLRRHLAHYLRSHDVGFAVLSFQEIAPEFTCQPVGTLVAEPRGELRSVA